MHAVITVNAGQDAVWRLFGPELSEISPIYESM